MRLCDRKSVYAASAFCSRCAAVSTSACIPCACNAACARAALTKRSLAAWITLPTAARAEALSADATATVIRPVLRSTSADTRLCMAFTILVSVQSVAAEPSSNAASGALPTDSRLPPTWVRTAFERMNATIMSGVGDNPSGDVAAPSDAASPLRPGTVLALVTVAITTSALYSRLTPNTR